MHMRSQMQSVTFAEAVRTSHFDVLCRLRHGAFRHGSTLLREKAPVPAEGKLRSPDLRRMKVKTPPQVTLKTRCKTERALAGGNGANTFYGIIPYTSV